MLFLKNRIVSKKIKQLVIYTIASCFFIFFIACKTKQANTAATSDGDLSTNSIHAKGIVSHKYKPQGCETIIVCTSNNSDTLFLIPATPLEKFDVDGLKISFTYHIVRIHNPKGCHQGIPAQISNITTKVNL